MTCQNCGNNHQENFCPNCGEKKFNARDLTIKHFFQETLESFIHFDNKFFKTLKILILKPGKLSLDFVEGRRVQFMKPLQLFLILNISMFFMPSNPFALRLYNYVTYTPFINYNTRQIIDNKVKSSGLTYKEYSSQFDEKIKSESKEFIFLFIPFYAIIFFLFLFLKRKNFAEHLVFSTHFMSFYLLFVIFNFVFIEIPFYLANKGYSQTFDTLLGIFTQVCIFVYLIIAIKKFYKCSIGGALLSSLAIASTFFILLKFYRMFLFYKIVFLH